MSDDKTPATDAEEYAALGPQATAVLIRHVAKLEQVIAATLDARGATRLKAAAEQAHAMVESARNLGLKPSEVRDCEVLAESMDNVLRIYEGRRD